jgi:serine/threonine-protein kinase RsbW
MMKTSQLGGLDPFIELSFPSELGYEKIARDAVAAFARRLGCDRERVEDLKTALGEACINAIEHGNDRAPGLRVGITCSGTSERLTVEVSDHGLQRYSGNLPASGIDLKLRGLAPRRGMGLLMISQLVDEAGFAEGQEGGNRFRLVLYFRKATAAHS